MYGPLRKSLLYRLLRHFPISSCIITYLYSVFPKSSNFLAVFRSYIQFNLTAIYTHFKYQRWSSENISKYVTNANTSFLSHYRIVKSFWTLHLECVSLAAYEWAIKLVYVHSPNTLQKPYPHCSNIGRWP